jgi:type VI secretion system secreted protein VgrG
MTPSVGPITLSGPDWATTAHCASLRLSEQLSSPFLYEIELISETPALAAVEALGDDLSIAVEVGDKKRYFSGVVTSLQSAGRQGENYVYRLRLRPWLWLLSRHTDCRIFQKAKVIDIVKKVFKDQGFDAIEPKLTRTDYAERPYVVQYRETDLNFVQRLLEEEGIYYFFQHEQGKHTLVLCDSLSGQIKTPFHDEVPHLPPDRHRGALLDYLDVWETVRDVESGAIAMLDYDYEDPGADLKASKASPEGHQYDNFEVFDYPGNYLQKKLGDTYAAIRLEEAKATAQRCHAQGNARGLLVGSNFTLSDHTDPAQNREYLVVSQEATLRGHALESGGATGDYFRTSIVAIPSDRQYRPPRITEKPVIHGAQTAKVVGAAGKEISTDNYGRVKLQFFWDRKSKGDLDSSCWVRVSQTWAGAKYGAMHIPRIGQEVIVEFLEGDPDRPIVTGRVYNHQQMPPYTLDDNQTQSGIKSRSTPGGEEANFNEIRFEDKKDEEELFIQAEKNKTVKVKNNRSASVGADDSVSVGGSRTESIDHDRTVTVGKAGAAKSRVDVTGSHDETATEYIKLDVNGTFIKIDETSITLQVKGGGKIVVDKKVLAQALGEGKLELTADAVMTAKGKAGLALSDKVLASSAGESTLQLDGDASLVGKGNANVTGTKKASFVGGESSQIDLEPAGATVSSKKSKLNGEAMTEIAGPVVKIN